MSVIAQQVSFITHFLSVSAVCQPVHLSIHLPSSTYYVKNSFDNCYIMWNLLLTSVGTDENYNRYCNCLCLMKCSTVSHSSFLPLQVSLNKQYVSCNNFPSHYIFSHDSPLLFMCDSTPSVTWNILPRSCASSEQCRETLSTSCLRARSWSSTRTVTFASQWTRAMPAAPSFLITSRYYYYSHLMLYFNFTYSYRLKQY